MVLATSQMSFYAILVGGSNGDGAWRRMVTNFEFIDPRPYKIQSPVYGRLIYTVIYMSDRLLTQANPDLHLSPPSELSRTPKLQTLQRGQQHPGGRPKP